jgi:RHS repeat-associated protein
MTHEFDRDRVDPGHQDVMTTDLDAALVAANETSNGGRALLWRLCRSVCRCPPLGLWGLVLVMAVVLVPASARAQSVAPGHRHHARSAHAARAARLTRVVPGAWVVGGPLFEKVGRARHLRRPTRSQRVSAGGAAVRDPSSTETKTHATPASGQSEHSEAISDPDGIFLPTSGPGDYQVYGYVESVTGGFPYGYQLDLNGENPQSFGCYPCSNGDETDLGSFAGGTNLDLDVWYDVYGHDFDMFSNDSSETTVTEIGNDVWQVVAADMTVVITAESLPPLGTLGSPIPGINDPECSTGDPVNCASGNFTQTTTDLEVPGNGLPLDLARTYNSLAASSEGKFGYGWTSSYEMALSFDSSGDATLTGLGGAQTTFMNLGDGTLSPPGNVFLTLVQNSNSSYTLTQPDGDTDTFSSSGQLTAESDLNGYTTTLSYNGSGQLTTVNDPAGRTLTFTYGSDGLVSSVSDSAGRTVSYGYDDAGNLTSSTDADGNQTSYTYDSDHDLLTVSGPRAGATVTNTYNSDGQVLTQQDPDGNTTMFSWGTPDASGTAVNTVTSPNGNVRSETYQDGVLQSRTEASGTSDAETWTYGYDPELDLTSETDPNGHTATATYNAQGDQTGTTDPDGNTTSATYNSFGEPTSTTDADGNTTTDSYDADGNLDSVSRTLTSTGQTQTTTYTYGDSSLPGDPTSITDPDGHATTLTYNAAGGVTSSTDPDGNQTTYSDTCSGTASAGCYSGVGLLYSQTSPRGNVAGANAANFTTTYTYDALGDELSETDPLGNTTKYSYDADGDLTSVKDPNGNTTQYTYNLDDEPTSTTQPGGQPETETYDGDGNVLTQTDGNGNTTHYAYNALDEQTSTTTPKGEETQYTYDPAGNLETETNPDGQVTTYGYDDANQLTSIDYSGSGNPDVTYGYDADGNQTSMTDATGSSAYTYNSLGELTAQADGAENTVDYGYDLDGNVTSIQYPNGKTVTNGYDDADNLASVTDWDGNETQFAYNADSEPDQTTYPTTNADVDTTSYDADDEITAISMKEGTATLASMAYNRNADEQVATSTETGLPEPTGATSDSYAYDNANDPTEIDSHTGYTYNSDQELTSSPSATYGYNAEGERTSQTPTTGAATTYSYDQNQSLTGVAPSNGTSETNAYDGTGLLTSQTTGSTTNQLTWDPVSDIPLLLDDGQHSYVYGPDDQPIEQITDSSGTVQFLHHDQLGSTRLITNTAGDQVGAATYNPYGKALTSTGTATTALGYAGQYTDPTTGLIYMRARWYDPDTAQFLTVDPLDEQTGQAYAYAADDPLDQVDPSGAWPSLSGIVHSVGTDLGKADTTADGVVHAVGTDLGEAGTAAEGVADGAGEASVGDVCVAGPEACVAGVIVAGGIYLWSKAHDNNQQAISTEGSKATGTSTNTNDTECNLYENPNRNKAQDKLLTPRDIQTLQDNGFDLHGGEKIGGSGSDLYKDADGNVYEKPKGGVGPGEPIGANLPNLRGQ